MHISNQSAGILLFRKINEQLEVLLIHPGGPFFKNKDLGSWSIPKGEFLDNEDPLHAAKREFEEETGQPVNGAFIKLSPVTQKSGKKVHAWAVEGNIDHEAVVSNHFEMEWPPKSGRQQSFPEVDRAGWFGVNEGKLKINPAQAAFIEELTGII
jgi:predicted NUDIX family NTP pyrophosphohydrolase